MSIGKMLKKKLMEKEMQIKTEKEQLYNKKSRKIR